MRQRSAGVVLLGLGLGLGMLLAPGRAAAHGLWGHIHVTGWAVENMPDDELRAFLLEPEVFNALLFGATFTDTGYAIDTSASRGYSEHAHWEPFIEDFITWIQVNDPPPWDDLESRKRVAFLMGCASHGLQDSIFDSLFLYQVEEHDGAGQDATDPATDGFLVLDEHIRFVPEKYLPMETLLELFADVDPEITEEVIQRAVSLVTGVYINDTGGQHVAETMGTTYAPQIPWAREHYLDPAIPGSLRAEIYPTMHYQQAVWARLHATFDADAVVVHAFPEAPRRLLSPAHDQVSSWASLVLGAGVHYEEGLVELRGPDGAVVPSVQASTRWGAEFTRVLRILPDEDLQPGGWYTARLRAGVETIDGQLSTQPWEVTFQVECDAQTADDCEDLGDIAVAGIDGLPEELEDSAAPTNTGDDDDRGCGCATRRQPAAPLALLLSLAALGWRRRRRVYRA